MGSLAVYYRLGETTVRRAVKETCEAINTHLLPTHLPPPSEEDWRDIAQNFFEKWQFPNCIGIRLILCVLILDS